MSGARARYDFKGRQIAWVAETGPTRGVANVYLDGVKVESIDLWSDTAQARKIVFTRTWATETVHALEIRVAGTPGRPRVDVDAVLVLRTP